MQNMGRRKTKPICVKVYTKGAEIFIAACDKKLLGKIFRDGYLKLEVSKQFYEGICTDSEGLIEHLKLATIANLVGEITVNAAVENGFIDSQCVIWIEGVPHAQLVKM